MPSVGTCMLMGQRADLALTERGLVQSRSRAKALITEGKVCLNGRPLTKPSEPVEDADILTVTEDLPYVGRGGLKLAGALELFPLTLTHRICMDVGASTGGFTDCMLQNGADRIYAIDVGHGQLAQSLREHPSVVNLEGTDIRELTPAELKPVPDFAGIDVSFISLRLVLPAVYTLLNRESDCIALIKPQFEAGRAHIGKHGIVRDPKAHVQVLTDTLAFARQIGFTAAGLTVSPIHGGSGNTEYLAWLTKGRDMPEHIPELHALVKSALSPERSNPC